MLWLRKGNGPLILVAEVFALLAECVLFWLAFGREARWRDFGAIVIANIASFVIGEVVFSRGLTWIKKGFLSRDPDRCCHRRE